MEFEAENCCTICSKEFDADAVTVDDDILNLFKFLLKSMDTSALKNALICAECLEKAKGAASFQSSHLEKQERGNTEDANNLIQRKDNIPHANKTNLQSSNEDVDRKEVKTRLSGAARKRMKYLLKTGLPAAEARQKALVAIPKQDQQPKPTPDRRLKRAGSNGNLREIQTIWKRSKKDTGNNAPPASGRPKPTFSQVTEYTRVGIISRDYPKVLLTEAQIKSIEEALLDKIQEQDTSALQNALICAACLEKAKEAAEFKSSYLEKQERNTETKQETDCEGKFVICYICKNTTKQNSSMYLLNICYDNVVSYMAVKEDLIKFVNPQICDSCHISALNFQEITLFLSGYDLHKTNDQFNNETVIDANEFKIDIFDECLQEDSKLNLGTMEKIKREIKEEIKLEEDTFHENFQVKKEELNLMDCEAGPSSKGFWCFYNQEKERSSTLQYPENVTTDENGSNLTTNLVKNEMDYQECSNNVNRATKDKSDHDNFDKTKMFKCSNCEFQTTQERYLKRHLLSHKTSDDEMFHCTSCEYRTKRKEYLKRHTLIHMNINEIKMFKCPSCEYQTKCKNYLNQHAIIHKNKMFKCQNCEFQTKYKSYLKTHILVHKKSNEVKMFKCQNCEFQTKYRRGLRKHILIHKNINEVKMFKCQICEYQTKRKDSLKLHERLHKNINEVEMFKCPSCKFQTKHKDYIKKHMLVHKSNYETEMFKCPSCEFQTKHKDYIKKHMFIHRNINESEMLKCTNCEFQTARKPCLITHMLIHKNMNEIETWKCPNCEYQTKHNCSLKKHMLIHKNIDEVEMFKCQNCEYQTKHKASLRQHLSIHKTTDEVKMFKCQICAFHTKYKSYLKRHILIHKNINEVEVFKCHNCEFQTKHKCSLRQHVLIHRTTDVVEKMFKCQICDFQTKRKSNLKKHLFLHKKKS